MKIDMPPPAPSSVYDAVLSIWDERSLDIIKNEKNRDTFERNGSLK